MFQSTKAEAREALFQDDRENKRPSDVRQMSDEFLSVEKATLHDGNQHRTREVNSWPPAHMYDGGDSAMREDLKFSLPFLLNTKKSTDCGYSVERKHYTEELAAFESAAQALSNMADNKENNFQITLPYHQKAQHELSAGEPKEKKSKEDTSADDSDADNKPTERESYWERRKKNNASAKKSRDARKAREQEVQIKAAFLERENLRMLTQLLIVQRENECLKRVLCAKYEVPL